MIRLAAARACADGLARIFPQYRIRVVPFAGEWRYEATALDQPVSVVITDDAAELWRALRQGLTNRNRRRQ